MQTPARWYLILSAVGGLACAACQGEEAAASMPPAAECVGGELPVGLDDPISEGVTPRSLLAKYATAHVTPMYWLPGPGRIAPEYDAKQVLAEDELRAELTFVEGPNRLFRVATADGEECSASKGVFARIHARVTTRDTQLIQELTDEVIGLGTGGTELNLGANASGDQLTGQIHLREIDGQVRLAGSLSSASPAALGDYANLSVPCGGFANIALDDARFGPSFESMLSPLNALLESVPIRSAEGGELGNLHITVSVTGEPVCLELTSRHLLLQYVITSSAGFAVSGDAVLRVSEPPPPAEKVQYLKLILPEEAEWLPLFPEAHPSEVANHTQLLVRFDVSDAAFASATLEY